MYLERSLTALKYLEVPWNIIKYHKRSWSSFYYSKVFKNILKACEKNEVISNISEPFKILHLLK